MNQRTRSILVASLVGCAFGLSAGSTMAGILFFENPPPGQEGHFNWHVGERDDPITFEQWLDITRPSTDQFGLASGSSVGQIYNENGGDSENGTVGGASVALAEGTSLTRAFSLGEVISDTANFDSNAVHVGMNGQDTDFEEGVLAYIGVKTEAGNFGWIAVVRDGLNLITTGWAYETEPGVPIRAGETPGVGGVALFGLLGLTSRRRRSL